MNLGDFVAKVRASLPRGSILKNPGSGTSTITDHSQSYLKYRRGKSTIRVSYESLFNAYSAHKGKRVSSSDLKFFAPSVFDSQARPAGHSCNATLLFLLLRELGLSSDIYGTGVKGDPYYVSIS